MELSWMANVDTPWSHKAGKKDKGVEHASNTLETHMGIRKSSTSYSWQRTWYTADFPTGRPKPSTSGLGR